MKLNRYFLILLLTFMFAGAAFAQQKRLTYCNPLNLDYAYTPFKDFAKWGKHRATADPTITLFKGKYYLFSTNQFGYWWSDDMLNWHFNSRSFLRPYNSNQGDNLCAPATLVLGDTLLVIGSTYNKDFTLWMSTDPAHNKWKAAKDYFSVGAWDPGMFLDDDGKMYIYFGSSNVYPLYGQEINRRTFDTIGPRHPLVKLDDEKYGWERFGENNDDVFLKGFIEGSWMNKHDGKYYLQFGAPGTEGRGYGDGVFTADKPFGPFTYQKHNPFSYKPGGFAKGAGHGATWMDKYGNYWHISTMVIDVKNNFERRIGFWPAGFDKDGVLYCNTSYGDYPHYLPDGKEDHLEPNSNFTGWMILNYNKPVRVSSTLGGHEPNYAVDEDIKTYWSAKSADKGEWLESDLGTVSTINAIQVDYADQDAWFMGKSLGVYTQYIIYSSIDGKNWKVLIDKSKNKTDVPQDYVELPKPVQARYLKIVNIHMPTGKFALSGFRAFGNGNGVKPDSVKDFIVLRGDSERRNSWLRWEPVDNAIGYTIYMGIAPDKLYNNIMVYGKNEYYFNGMDRDLPYYFQIEAFNENGISARTKVIEVK
ncbi:MAG TPA: family 43 glycosylhydrolase [Mucilaginibacter sp.]|nr:family 43 glycosylhydrolase [Mucilaginibacter sp.]